jgi:cobalt/nickel transport system permease protein
VAFNNFMMIFAVTQVPLAIAEGILTVVIFDYVMKLRPDILEKLKVIGPKVKEKVEAVV